MFSIGTVIVMLAVLAAANPAVCGEGYSKQQQLVDKARLTFDKFAGDPAIGWSPDHAAHVKGILIVPAFLKGAFGVGVAGGSGVFLARDEETGEWSQPAFYTLGAPSFGLQIGADATEMVILVNTTGAMESFYSSSFKLGGDANIAAGPAGRGVKGWTRMTFGGGMVGYMVSKGLFAGMSVEGVVVANAGRSNEAYYGQGTRPTDILAKRTVSNPGSEKLRAAVADAMQ